MNTSSPNERPHVFVLRADLTQLQADAIVYPTSTSQEDSGHLSASMKRSDLGFHQVYFDGDRPAMQILDAPAQAYWVSLEAHGRTTGPFGVVVTATVEDHPGAGPTSEIIRAATHASLRVALEALGDIQSRQIVRDAFTRDVEQALRPIARRWRLRDPSKRALRGVSARIAEDLEPSPQSAGLEARRLRVAFPALGTGSAGGRLGEVSAMALARAQVAGVIDALDDLDDALRARIDVVLVAYNDHTHHRFIKARREALERHWRFDEASQQFLPRDEHAPRPWLQRPVDRRTTPSRTLTLADAIARGECVLFVGSGLSSGVGMKSWWHLIDALLEDLQPLADAQGLTLPTLEHASTEDYLDIAQWHAASREALGAPSHQRYINQFFGPEATRSLPLSLAHYLLLSLPFRHIITTNYDDLIERTLEALRQPHARIVHDRDVPRTGRSDEVSVVKFHGHAFSPSQAARKERGRAGDTLVLTREEYDTFFHRHPAKALLLEGLLLNHHFFFMGYSLSDPDFRQIQNRVIHMLQGAQRKAYATTLDDHRHWARAQWEDRALVQIPFHDGQTSARVHAMWCWLDSLSELVMGAPTTFLTDASAGALPDVHGALLTLGRATEAACRDCESLDAEQLAVLERVLDLLSDFGWTPSHVSRSWVEVWTQLAEHRTSTDADRLRLLRKAMVNAERSEDIDQLRALLRPLEAAISAMERPDGEDA